MPNSLQGENEPEFYLPLEAQRLVRPFRLTPLQLELLQRIADGGRYKDMTTVKRDLKCFWNMAHHMRVNMEAEHNAHAVAIGIRSGIIR